MFYRSIECTTKWPKSWTLKTKFEKISIKMQTNANNLDEIRDYLHRFDFHNFFSSYLLHGAIYNRILFFLF